VKTGSVIHECMPRHRAAEFLRFARKVVRSVPHELDVYVILDNVSTQKTSAVMCWLDKNPRVFFHFVPTSASWANLVERLFSELTQAPLRRLVTHNVPELIAAITSYLDTCNSDPKPFVWTASLQSILTKVAKAKETLATNQTRAAGACAEGQGAKRHSWCRVLCVVPLTANSPFR
jgi:hypothetical protein